MFILRDKNWEKDTDKGIDRYADKGIDRNADKDTDTELSWAPTLCVGR